MQKMISSLAEQNKVFVENENCYNVSDELMKEDVLRIEKQQNIFLGNKFYFDKKSWQLILNKNSIILNKIKRIIL
jgi:hypothetical protein